MLNVRPDVVPLFPIVIPVALVFPIPRVPDAIPRPLPLSRLAPPATVRFPERSIANLGVPDEEAVSISPAFPVLSIITAA